jgi:uncharacterized protein YggU (UPF0235/DUF167 family)
MYAGRSAPGSHRPRLALALRSLRRVPVVACRVHATHVGRLRVRVIPRSRKTGVEAKPDAIVVRVRATPQGGRATEEARRALAVSLGIPPSGVTLHRGRRSREKIFDLGEMTEAQALQRLRC